MKKRLFLVLLSFVSVLTICLLNRANADENGTGQAEVVAELTDLINYYRNDGVYTKHTLINVDTSKIENDIASYFHSSVSHLERTTYYSHDALWMSRGKEAEGVTYSYYGTHYVDGVAAGVTNATAHTPRVAPESPRVVLSGEGKNSMEEYYVTLFDILPTADDSWTVENGVYSTDNEVVLDEFRNFTAPLWLNTEIGSKYLDFVKATIEEKGDNLLLKLWVSSTEKDGKLVANAAVDGDYALFSVATISAPYIFKGVTFEGEGTYNDGIDRVPECMIDNNLETFTWFIGKPTSVVFELSKEILLTDITVYQGGYQVALTDMMAADIEVSTNGVDYTSIGKLEYRDYTYVNFATPHAAKYIRFNNTDSETWVAIREVLINQAPSITLNGFQPYQNEFINAFDGNTETYVHVQTVGKQYECGMVLDYGKMVEFNTINVMTAPTGGDCFWGFKASYSIDGETYYDLVEMTADHPNVRNYTHQTPTAINARYIKIEGVGDVTNWLQVYEISLSLEDVVGIKPVFDELNGALVFKHFVDQNDVEITIDSELYSIHYSGEGYNSPELPTEPGWYSVVVTLNEEAGYNLIGLQYPLTGWVVFNIAEPETEEIIHIDPIFRDTGNGFVFDGFVDVEGNPIELDSSLYSVYYETSDEEYIGTTLPTEPGKYSIIAHLNEEANYHFITLNRENLPKHVWKNFEVKAEDEIIKVDPEVIFSIESGVQLTIGVDAAPTVTVPEGVEYRIYYTLDGVEISNELPTTPGTYAINIQTVENDTYNAWWGFRWFVLNAPATAETTYVTLVTTQNEDNVLEFVGFVDAEGNEVVIDSSLYNVWYELNEKETTPEKFEAGNTYSLVVKFVDGANYRFITGGEHKGNETKAWPWFVYTPAA